MNGVSGGLCECEIGMLQKFLRLNRIVSFYFYFYFYFVRLPLLLFFGVYLLLRCNFVVTTPVLWCLFRLLCVYDKCMFLVCQKIRFEINETYWLGWSQPFPFEWRSIPPPPPIHPSIYPFFARPLCHSTPSHSFIRSFLLLARTRIQKTRIRTPTELLW